MINDSVTKTWNN